jgi:broad specificity phosphatase PhoE
MAARVWCLRHGESANVTGEIAGQVPNAPLTDAGHRQATRAARTLADEPITHVYTSTALRARQTAQPFTADVRVLPELAEVGIGRHEGTRDPAVRRRMADVLHAWVVDNDLSQRIADGETGYAVVARMTTAFQHIAQHHQGATVAVVGHVASPTVALSQLCALGAQVWGTPLPHAEPFLIELDGESWHCLSWPGQRHDPNPGPDVHPVLPR